MRKPPVVILASLVSFASVLAVLFTPALPEIGQVFGVSPGLAEMTITVFLVGYAVGQLIYGPIANRLGRKGALYIGLTVSLLGSLLCILSGWFDLFFFLIIGRIITALGASCGLVVTFTMVGDCYSEAKARNVVSILMISFAALPGIAVAIGGFLTERFGWESCFYFLFLYNIWMLFLVLFLPETSRPEDRHPIPVKELARGYGRELRHGFVVAGGIVLGLGTSIIYVMAARSPYLAIEIMGYTPAKFGLLILIPQLGAIIGSGLSILFSKRLRSERAIFSGIAGALGVACLMWVLQVVGWLNWATVFVTTAFIYIGLIFEYTGVSAMITTRASDKARASSLMSFLNMLMPTLSVLIVQFVPAHWALGLATIFVGLLLAMLLVFLGVFHPLIKRENSA